MLNWKGYGRNQWLNAKYYHSTCPEELKGTMKNRLFVNYYSVHYFTEKHS
jgi:hypothetical protein